MTILSLDDGIVVTAEEGDIVKGKDKVVFEKFVPSEEWQEVKEGKYTSLDNFNGEYLCGLINCLV